MINNWISWSIILTVSCGMVLGHEPNWESLNVPPLIDDSYRYNDQSVHSTNGAKKLHRKVFKQYDVANIAVDESLKWQNGVNPTPVLKADGVVRFPYGEYQPTITCKPLNLCDIELQANEQIQGILIGDSIRWNDGDQGIPVVYSGEANKLVPHLVLKPSQAGLDTTLMVTTSKRTYMIRLCSSSHGYVERAGFYYPHEEVVNYRLTATQIKNKAIESSGINAVIQKSLTSHINFGSQKSNSGINSFGKRGSEVETLGNAESGKGGLERADSAGLNYKYSITGSNYLWKPVQVFDDGISVFIKMPDEIDARSLPSICVLGVDDDSHCQLVNFRYKNHFFIIDQLFDKAKLVNGFGNNAETILIKRGVRSNGGRHRGWSHLFGG